MEGSQQPSIELAERVLPPPLLAALRHVFAQGITECGLVGGTALAGFYAGHRRSDHLNLFARSPEAMRGCTLAVDRLGRLGAKLSAAVRSGQYYRVLCELDGHRFTVDVVEDENVFQVETFVTLSKGITVADLQTLLCMKAATLVSRCSEKDLYDLVWLFERFPNLSIAELIELGRSIDLGMDAESVLASVAGAELRESACGFALDPAETPKKVHQQICRLRDRLVVGLTDYLRQQPAPPLGELVKKLKKRR